MELYVQERVEIAIRSLNNTERLKVRRALGRIAAATFEQLCSSGNLSKLPAQSGQNLYSYRAVDRLHLVLAISGQRATVEDLANEVLLDRLLRQVQH